MKPLVACVLLAALTQGCAPVTLAVGAGTEVGTAAAEERGVEGAADDLRIRAEINDLWFRHDAEMYQKVTLTVHEGRVLLTGSVKKPEQRVDAVRLSWQAAGVREVLDEIQVEDSSGIVDYGRDVLIANNLRARLLFDKQIRNVNYTVDVVNGVVYLMGIAQNGDELERVIAHARDISHVQKVISHVILKNDPQRQGL
jgi:osmotically-inducible protein OsmY